MPHHIGDISVFSIGGSSQLAYFDNVTLTTTNMTANTASVGAAGQRSSIMKSSATIDVNLRSVSGTTSDAATHLDLTSLAIGALTFTCFSSCALNISYATAPVPCVGSRYKLEDNTNLILTADITVQAVSGTASTLMIPFNSAAALSTSNVTFTLIYNAVTYAIPMLIQEVSLVAERDGIQEINIKLEGRAPDTGAYPTTPTSTTGLLNKALNDYNTALAVSFQSITSTNGVNVSGNFKFQSASFEIADEQIVPVAYQFKSEGAVTIVQGS
jgi:hypothetical protein